MRLATDDASAFSLWSTTSRTNDWRLSQTPRWAAFVCLASSTRSLPCVGTRRHVYPTTELNSRERRSSGGRKIAVSTGTTSHQESHTRTPSQNPLLGGCATSASTRRYFPRLPTRVKRRPNGRMIATTSAHIVRSAICRPLRMHNAAFP
jgi:hypothetical protein